MSDDAAPNDMFVSDAEKLELALCLKSTIESWDGQVVFETAEEFRRSGD